MKIISFEGIEGVGKSTQIDLLHDYLLNAGKSVKKFREPGSTIPSEKIRDILLDINNNLSKETELLLMFSARSELVNKIILDNQSDYLLLDRFFDASMAYQGYGRELSKEFISSLISFIKCPIPNFTFLLDIPVEEGFSRKHNDTMDRIESSGFEFFDKVRKGYLEIASNNDDRFIVINANNDIDSIHNEILFNLNIK